MRSGKRWKVYLSLPFTLFLIIVVTGCSLKLCVPHQGVSGFLKKEFLEYKSLSILPFEGNDSNEVSKAFAMSFHERFPQISIADRKQVSEVLRGQFLTSDWLDGEGRLRIGNTLGVHALITGNIYYPSITRWFLQVVIFDTETGKVMGRSLVEIDYMGAMGKGEAARFLSRSLPYGKR